MRQNETEAGLICDRMERGRVEVRQNGERQGGCVPEWREAGWMFDEIKNVLQASDGREIGIVSWNNSNMFSGEGYISKCMGIKPFH